MTEPAIIEPYVVTFSDNTTDVIDASSSQDAFIQMRAKAGKPMFSAVQKSKHDAGKSRGFTKTVWRSATA